MTDCRFGFQYMLIWTGKIPVNANPDYSEAQMTRQRTGVSTHPCFFSAPFCTPAAFPPTGSSPQQLHLWATGNTCIQMIHVGLLPRTCQNEGKPLSRSKMWQVLGKATLTSGLLLGRSEVLRSLRHYMWAQSQGHHTTDCLQERGVERGSARWYSLKGRERAIVNQTDIGTVSKATLGKLLRERVKHIIMGFSKRVDTILNWLIINGYLEHLTRTGLKRLHIL